MEDKTPLPSFSGRVLAVDYGDVRTGLAISDESLFLASGIGTIEATGDRALARKINEVAKSRGVGLIIVGDPINMNGTRGPRSEKARAFAEKLRAETGLPVVLEDERCTTLSAQVFLNETETRKKKRKAIIDALSAEIMLQNFLDRIRNLKK